MIAPSQRRAVVSLMRPHLDKSTRPAINKAAREHAQEDLTPFSLSLLNAIPPSPHSHVEGGNAGLALLRYLSEQPEAPPLIKVAREAAEKSSMYTSMRDFATLALESTASASPSAFARLGIDMVESCLPPYPFDGAVAGNTVLEALADLPMDDLSREFLGESRAKIAALEDKGEQAEQAVETFRRLITLQERRAEVIELTATPKEAAGVQETATGVRVGGIMLPRRR